MIQWSETDFTEFFGVLGVYDDAAASYGFSVERDGVRLLVTLFPYVDTVYVSLYRNGWPVALFTVEQPLCSHAHVISEGRLRYLEVGCPARPVSSSGRMPVLERGIRIQVEPQISIRLIESR